MRESLFLRLLPYDDKAAALAEAVAAVREGRTSNPVVHPVDPASFRQVPGSPFAYWVSERIRRLFTELPPFESEGRTVKQGLATVDDFRFVRAWWEVAPERILDGANGPDWREDLAAFQAWCRQRTFEGKRRVPFAKGGAYSPYYADLHLVVNWEWDGEEIRNFDRAFIRNEGVYFRPGLTWPLRTQLGFNMRTYPAGAIFGHKGPVAFVSQVDLPLYLGLSNTNAFGVVISLQMAFGSYEVGVIQRTPIPDLTEPDGKQLSELAQTAINLKRSLDIANETSHVFVPPSLLQVSGDMLAKRIKVWTGRVAEAETNLAHLQQQIDEIAFRLYGIAEEDQRTMRASLDGRITVEDGEEDEASSEDERAPAADTRNLVADLLGYALGAALGRWDIRYATGQRSCPELPDPFAPLPVCSPGMLQGEDGLPQPSAPEGYPSRVNLDGFLVDDEGHPDDIIRRVRDVLEFLWGEHAGAIEEEACEILGVKGLREIFRKPALFFNIHIKHYSKSRRKAPIYWCLSTPSQSYVVWLYYHRFSRDTFYKVLNDYVTPKLQHEQRKLDHLRAEGGVNPTPSQRKEIADQEVFLEELRIFREGVARIAPLWNPNLNDGVIINFAPLWRLVPQHRAWQQECKAVWDKLVQGEYDWAHLAMHLWPERVVPKCRTDHSLAIAHGLEDAFWEEDKAGKWTPKDVSDEEVEALIRKWISPAVKAALENLLSASAPAAGRPRGSGGRASHGRKRSSTAPTNNAANSMRRKRGSTGDDE